VLSAWLVRSGLAPVVRGHFLLDRRRLAAAFGHGSVAGRADAAAAAYVRPALDEPAHLASLRVRVVRTTAGQPDDDDRGDQPEYPDQADDHKSGRGR
jgi:hypothetical protein